MREARNPLVREIEEAAVRGSVEGASPEDWEAYIITSSAHYNRLRAALEAAEEMAEYAEAMEADVGCPPAVADWLKRYRAATREE